MFFLRLEKVGKGASAHWVVNNWVPRASAVVPGEEGCESRRRVQEPKPSATVTRHPRQTSDQARMIVRDRSRRDQYRQHPDTSLSPAPAGLPRSTSARRRTGSATSSAASRRAGTGRASGGGCGATGWPSRAACSSSSCSSSPLPGRRRRQDARARPERAVLPIGGVDAEGLPAGAWTHVPMTLEDGDARDPALPPRCRFDPRARRVSPHPLRGAGLARGRVGATFLSLLLGVLLGAVAGFYRGWVDTVISRVIEMTMAFPVPAVRDRSRRHDRHAAQQGHVRLPR